jgi:hypothetical protein
MTPMKTRFRILPTLGGLIVGLMAGMALGTFIAKAGKPDGSAFLRNVRFDDLTAKAGHPNWEIVEDKTYDRLPPLSRRPRISRRIVAQTSLAASGQSRLIELLQQGMSEALATHGAVIRGEVSLSRSQSEIIEGRQVLTHLEMPRLYYAIGDIHGVADVWFLADSGRVTAIVSLIEGP